MKHLTFVFILFVLLLSACATPATATVLPPTETAAAAPTLTETPAATTTTPPTATLTKIPATPTVDLAGLPTLTPQVPAACPQVDAKAKFSVAGLFKNKKLAYYDVREATLEFLNRGGNPQIIIQKLGENNVAVTSMDVTNDGMKELLIPSGYLSIFGCQGGQYKTLLDIAPIESYPGPWAAVPLVIQDLNKNGIPEIIIAQPTKGWGFEGFMQFADYSILEWDGAKLAKIIGSNYQSTQNAIVIKDGVMQTAGHSRASNSSINGNWKIEDTDNNGLKDVTILAGINDSSDASQLEEKVTLKWDGKNYKVSSTAIESTATPVPTRTPLPFSATCDYKATGVRLEKNPTSVEKSITDFLNAGGKPEMLKELYGIVAIKDLNKDSIPEIVLKDYEGFWYPYIFGCVSGKYKNLLAYESEMANETNIQIVGLKRQRNE